MNDFIELVREMRDAQKDFFRNRTWQLQKKAMRLETLVDNYLARIPSGTAQGNPSQLEFDFSLSEAQHV